MRSNIRKWQDRMVFLSYTTDKYRIPSCMDLMQEEIDDLRAQLKIYEDMIDPHPKRAKPEQLRLDL